MKRFGQFIAEGGNVKIGDFAAVPVDVKHYGRKNISNDVSGFLTSLGDSFKQKHGGDLFGPGHSNIHDGTAFSGSSHHLFSDKISDEELSRFKPKMGDIDVKVPKEHMGNLHEFLKTEKHHGPFHVLGHTRSGKEIHALVQHKGSGRIHQVDFEGTETEKGGKISKFSQFAHSSHWDDTKKGIKGLDHKTLLSALGMDKYKYGSNGLISRSDESDRTTDVKEITSRLFSPKADPKKTESFVGLVDHMKKFVPQEHHDEIVQKFNNSKNSTPEAKKYLQKHITNNISSVSAVISPLVGVSPISHMGHYHDLGKTISSIPGRKYIGISKKGNTVFSPEEREKVLRTQFGKSIGVLHSTSGGESVSSVYHSLPAGSQKHLHMVVGHDRKEFAEGLKDALENGKIKEMKGKKWDSVTIHYPENTERQTTSKGIPFSGTNMRKAAAQGDLDTFHEHLGPNFTRKTAKQIMQRVQKGIAAGHIKLKR